MAGRRDYGSDDKRAASPANCKCRFIADLFAGKFVTPCGEGIKKEEKKKRRRRSRWI